jgi:hypothetical protein
MIVRTPVGPDCGGCEHPRLGRHGHRLQAHAWHPSGARVSFSADVARYCGLRVFPVNMTSFRLIQSLALWNDYEKKW